MNVKQLNSVFESMSPSEAQKEKMLSAILSSERKTVRKKTVHLGRFAATAAVIAIVGVGTALVLTRTESPADIKDTMAVKSSRPAQIDSDDVNTDVPSDYRYSIFADTTNNAKDTESVNKNEKAEIEPKVYDVKLDNSNDSTIDNGSELPELYEETEVAEEYDDNETEKVEYDSAPAVTKNENEAATKKRPHSGGSGGGGGSSAPASTQFIALSDIRNHPVYSKCFPSYIASDFQFQYATENGFLRAEFADRDGKRLVISVLTQCPDDVIEKENIVDDGDGIMSFSLAIGDCYVKYYAETYDVNEIYKMATSSQY